MDSVSLKFRLSLFINLRTKFRKLSSPLIVFHMASPICYTTLVVFEKCFKGSINTPFHHGRFDLNKRTFFSFRYGPVNIFSVIVRTESLINSLLTVPRRWF